MNKSKSIELIDKANLTEQTKFQLDKISEIENYFCGEERNKKIKEIKENHAVKN